MLELRGVHAHYGLSHVLQGVTLSVGAGEIVGLFGRNGVGKTTVMKTIAGWVAPSGGEIRFEGRALGGEAPERVCRAGIGFVPEDRRIFPGLTVEENLVLGFMQAPRRGRAGERRKLDEIYARFPRLGERRSQMGTTLSGGEQQMLAIARVLAGEPRLLLVDEPTEGLAPQVVDDIFRLLAELRAEGIAVLLVEQNLHRAIDVVQRFYALERGAVVLEGDAAVPGDRDALVRQLSV